MGGPGGMGTFFAPPLDSSISPLVFVVVRCLPPGLANDLLLFLGFYSAVFFRWHGHRGYVT